MEKVYICELRLAKDYNLMDSEIKRVFTNQNAASDYIKEEAKKYVDYRNGEAYISEEHNSFIIVKQGNWERIYIVLIKPIEG